MVNHTNTSRKEQKSQKYSKKESALKNTYIRKLFNADKAVKEEERKMSHRKQSIEYLIWI